MTRSIGGESKAIVARKWATLFLSVVLALGACVGCDGATGEEVEGSSGKELAKTGETAPAASTLTIEVTAPDWPEEGGSVPVCVQGETTEQKEVVKTYFVKPNTKKEVNLDPGTYDLSVVTTSLDSDSVIWRSSSRHVDLEAGKSAIIALELVHDREAMEKAVREAEEKAKAEAEARAKAEAEAAAQAQAQREAEEAAARAAEAKAAQSRASEPRSTPAPQASAQNGATVYIAASGNGTKYHRSPSCSNMKGTVTLSVSDAQARGYGPCKKCY